MSKDLIREQFSAHADAYRTSTVHAKGVSLARLVELVDPQPEWQMLDVATGGGHTAMIFAPYVARVIASDLTPEMLPVAEKLANEREITNVSYEQADAEELPFEDGRFDLVTCRIAAHHFGHVDRFLNEAHRVLKDGGVLAIVDNVAPEGVSGDYVNRCEKLRDPSHHRALDSEEWQHEFTATGFDIAHVERVRKRMEFQLWAERLGASVEVIAQVRAMLINAPDDVADYFHPEFDGDILYFYLTEAIILGSRVQASTELEQ